VKTVREFYTYDNAFHVLILLVLVLTAAALSIPEVSGKTLPRKIGRINDYANVLGVGDHKKLENKLLQLHSQGKGLTILISLRDPYSNSNQFGFEVSRKWNIYQNPAESLFVFIREEQGWVVSFSFSPPLVNIFSNNQDYRSFQEKIKEKTHAGDIRKAVLESVNRIYSLQFPSDQDKSTSEEKKSTNKLIFYVLGGILLFILLLLLIVREARMRCPRCGARMKVNVFNSEFGEKQREKYCPRCGYYERG